MRPLTRRRLLLITLAIVVVAGVALAVLLPGRGGGVAPLSDDFLASPGTPIDADLARAEVDAAIAQLTVADAVEIRSVAFVEGRRFDAVVLVDRPGTSFRAWESLSAAEPGQPADPAPIISESTLVGDTLWLRILQPGQDPNTPYQAIDASGRGGELLDAAFTQSGRIFDSLARVQAIVAGVALDAERLPPRGADGEQISGVRLTLRAGDVAEFLGDNGLELVDGHDLEGATILEFWSGAGGLTELVATGVQFEDGEALESAARIAYRVVGAASIEAPGNTVPS